MEPKGWWHKEVEDLRQQLETSQKREVMLRCALNMWMVSPQGERNAAMHEAECVKSTLEALAATDDLKDVRLCHAKPTIETLSVVTNTGYVYVRAIDRKVEPNTKLFSAWEQKP